ncbi:hypothetical protein LMG33810_002198 [Carnimonas sp. LMG 33810]
MASLADAIRWRPCRSSLAEVSECFIKPAPHDFLWYLKAPKHAGNRFSRKRRSLYGDRASEGEYRGALKVDSAHLAIQVRIGPSSGADAGFPIQ